MIGSVRGELLERSATGEVLVEACGVGYRVLVSPATLAAAGEPGAQVFLHVHHHVREDAHTLYGFLTREERACFEALLGAHGVGPAMALAILSVHTPASLRRILADDDVASLCHVPGVGRKTAARLLLELKARLQVPDIELDVETAPAARADVRAALAELGYGPEEVRTALAELPDDGDPSLLLKQALQQLALVR